MASRWSIPALCLVLGVLLLGWIKWRGRSSTPESSDLPRPAINKQPVNFVNRAFDPGRPPSDMPPLTSGESAECDSEFLSNPSVRGQTQQADAIHATVTITHITVTLQLNITIWVPMNVTQHVMEHEQGHRQISEYFYQAADQVAERVAANYLGRKFDITGSDLNAESNKLLQQMATAIADEYNQQMDPRPAQLLYDSITDHSRNDVLAQDAVAHALKNVSVEFNSSEAPR